ncbi:hypothetical protein MRX96_019355 [Rhipicephalus microplus]
MKRRDTMRRRPGAASVDQRPALAGRRPLLRVHVLTPFGRRGVDKKSHRPRGTTRAPTLGHAAAVDDNRSRAWTDPEFSTQTITERRRRGAPTSSTSHSPPSPPSLLPGS